MLEITADDIAALSDEDLRSLIARLCEAEMRRLGLPTSSVTWGGDQDAPDGGVDVRIDLPKRTVMHGFVPRAATGFQVKKSDITPSEISKEMRPRGTVRAVIRELAERSGAYIIISSRASVTDSALRKRREAMATAVKGIKNRGLLTLDFYDRGRVATWLRDHPGLIPWVRQKLGKTVQGWRSYGAWAYPAEGEGAAYLLDEMVRIRTGKKAAGGVTAAEGLKLIRDTLREPRKVVRIVGLSGVGKTRLVQALFDGRVDQENLDPSLAIYTNLGDDPDPQPVVLASDLIASKTRAILVIDNCPPDLHRRLSEVCRSLESLLSLVTVEYDIRDDDPEDTDVFHLDPSSVRLIEKLLQARFKSLSQIDRGTIAQFSGGNAKVAIALAGTIGKNETVAGITDDELFGRLFRQRHEHDPSLLLIAQACSLVYSFQGEAIAGDGAELPLLAAMIGKSVDEVFRGIGELRDRELVQQRSVWRAVLPHAITNRLAKMALRNIPAERIQAVLIEGGSARLLKSFSRRLGYLHDSERAVRLVESWLAKGGLLSDVANLSQLRLAMFENIAPVAPEAVLAALERVPPEALTHREAFKKIIRSIAYEARLFERCAELLLRIGATEQPDSRVDPDRYFTSLFFIAFSGTHASIEQRIKVLDVLLRSDERYRRAVGVKALRNILEAWHFGSGFDFEFGARPRDYGFYPKTSAELKHWYVSALKLVESFARSDLGVADAVRSAFASQFRGLWSQPSLHTELDRISRLIAQGGFWRDGWIAVSQTLKYDYKSLKNAARAKLVRLEKALRPKDLLQKVRGIVLGGDSYGLELEEDDYDSDDDGGSLDRINRIAASLGKDVAHDPKVMKALLPELMTAQGRLWSFGRGLAADADDPRAMWNALIAQFAATTPESRRNTQVLGGYLDGLSKRDPALLNDLLDDAAINDGLAAWFPELQAAVVIDARGAARLQQSLSSGTVPLERFRVLAWGRASDPISGPDLKSLLVALGATPPGWDVAIEILYMRLFSDRQEKKSLHPALIETGRHLLKAIQFKKSKRNGDHRIGSLIKVCLTGPEGAEVVRSICDRFKEAVASGEIYSFEHDHLLQSIFKAQPSVALDAFLGGDAADQKRGCKIICEASRNHANPLDFVPLNDLVTWCSHDPSQRFPLVARAVTLFKGNPDQSTPDWTETVLALIDKAPDRVAVLKQLARRLRPMSWSGSRAVAMEMRLPLLQKLASYADPAVAEFARAEEVRLKAEVELEKQHENRDDKERDERFE